MADCSPTLSPSPEVSAAIQRHIDALRPQGLPDWPIRVCKEELNALPIHANAVDVWAIRPDGTILCLDLDSIRHAADPETNAERALAALVQGAKQYPELRELTPASK